MLNANRPPLFEDFEIQLIDASNITSTGTCYNLAEKLLLSLVTLIALIINYL